MLVANSLSALANFGFAMTGGMPGAAAWALGVLGILSLVNVGGAAAIWMRMKVGFYAILGSVGVGLMVNLSQGQLAGILGAVIGPAILWWLISDEWHTYT